MTETLYTGDEHENLSLNTLIRSDEYSVYLLRIEKYKHADTAKFT